MISLERLLCSWCVIGCQCELSSRDFLPTIIDYYRLFTSVVNKARGQFDLCQCINNTTYDELINLKKDYRKNDAIYYNITITNQMT